MKSGKVKKAFRVLSRKVIFRGRAVGLDLLEIRTPSGREVERSLVRGRGVAVMVPILSDGTLILIRQLRVAAGRPIWEFPAGSLEKGESIFHCAKRELEEETGWKAGRLRKVLEFYPTPGISDERMSLFIADKLGPGTVHSPDEDEELEVKAFTKREIAGMIRQRRIVDGKTILGFLFFCYFL